MLYPLSYGAGGAEDTLPLRVSPAGALEHDGEPGPCRASLRVVWGCRFSAPQILLCSSLPAGSSARHWHKWEERHELVTS